MRAINFRSSLSRLAIPSLACALAATGTIPARASDWPGFRGPNADGISDETGAFSSLDAFRLETAWKVKIGSGYSGVAIAEGKVVTMFSDETSDFVIALDPVTGSELWRFDLGPTYNGHDGSHTGPIATPLIAADKVFALTPRGQLFALAIDTGKPAWSADLVADLQAVKPGYGFATSPIFLDGVLIVQIGAKDAAVAGFDPQTGSRLWTASADSIQYQSPIAYTLDGRRHLLATGDKNLTGIDPRSGEILWEQPHQGTGYIGVASLVPVPAGPNRLFIAFKDEASALVQLSQTDGTVTATQSWENRSIRNTYNVPVFHQGHLYAYSSRFLTCVDAATGTRTWRTRQPGDGFLILVDGHLVIATKKGSLHVVHASPDGYTERAALPLFDDLIWSPPSFADGSIFVRSLGEIARVNVRPGADLAKRDVKPQRPAPDSDFARFLEKVRTAPDKKTVIDRYLAAQSSFPIIEGKDRVHFLYRGPASDLALAGDIFGSRQEHPMARLQGTDLFYFSTTLEPDARLNYLFARDYEAIIDPLNPRKTTSAIYTKEMEMSHDGSETEMSWLAMPDWKPPAHLDHPAPARRGRIETHSLQSKLTETKYEIHVYLPAGYDDDKDRHYPVAVVFGGQTAMKRGRFQDTLDVLVGKTVEPLLVAFIDAPAWGQSEKYSDMIATELIPFIDTEYRTIRAPHARACIATGPAGVEPFSCVFKNPELFGKVAAQSAFAFETATKGLDKLFQAAAGKPIRIYMDWGTYDLRSPLESWNIAEGNRKLLHMLKKNGFAVTGGPVHDGTGWSSWRNRTDDVFQTLFPIESPGRSPR